MTEEQKIALADKVIERQAKQKAYDKWYMAKAKHELSELRRIVKENELEGEIAQFEKTVIDYVNA